MIISPHTWHRCVSRMGRLTGLGTPIRQHPAAFLSRSRSPNPPGAMFEIAGWG